MGRIIGWYPQLKAPAAMDPSIIKFTEETLIHLSDPNTSFLDIQADRRHPMRFQTHPKYTKFYCAAWDLQQEPTSPNIRRLVVQWTTQVDALLKDGKPVYDNDPLLRPISYDIDSWEHTKTWRLGYTEDDEYDIKKGPPVPSVPITTTAGEPIFVQEPYRSRMFNCERNVAGLPKFMSKCDMFTNADKVKFANVSWEPRQLLATNIRLSRPMFEYGRVYYRMTWQMLVAPDEDGWCTKRRNAGYHEKRVVRKANAPPITKENAHELVAYNPKHYETIMDAIVVGPPENRSLPSSPVLLTPEGRAYRAPGPGQDEQTPFFSRTGPVISVEGVGIGGLPGIGPNFEELWKKAELKFFTVMPISFKKFIPLR